VKFAGAFVEGKVSVKGTPLAKGKIAFHGPLGAPIVAEIKDGFFTARDVPVGVYTVTVEGQGVPRQFSLPQTTPLRVEMRTKYNDIGRIDLP
jgi:hypothetical protein